MRSLAILLLLGGCGTRPDLFCHFQFAGRFHNEIFMPAASRLVAQNFPGASLNQFDTDNPGIFREDGDVTVTVTYKPPPPGFSLLDPPYLVVKTDRCGRRLLSASTWDGVTITAKRR